MLAGRRTKYTPEISAEIVKLLSGGCLVVDICLKVGINQDTYFTWLKKHPEFSEAVNRAKADANVGAVLSLRTAMQPHDTIAKTVKVFKETRLRKVRTKGGVSEVPYEYVKTEQSQTNTNEFDWRAALEFLKRRDPTNWAETFVIKVTPEQADVLKRYGKTAGEAFEELVKNLSEAEHEQ